MPSPLPAIPHVCDPCLPDFGSRHRAEPVPQDPHCLVADFEASLGEEATDIAERKREANIIMTARRMISGFVLKCRQVIFVPSGQGRAVANPPQAEFL